MGWSNGPPSWAEMERVLSGRSKPGQYPGDGGDAPAWSNSRGKYLPEPAEPPTGPLVPYAELHTHSAFSFLDGASQPEEMVAEAARLGLSAIALTDHNGYYGVVRFAEAAAEHGIAAVYGAELTLVETGSRQTDSAPRTGEPDPDGEHLLVLARGREGYRRLSRQLAAAHMAAGEKGILRYDLDTLTAAAGGHWQILTGCRKGRVRRALEQDLRTGGPPRRAEAALRELCERFGTGRVTVELTRHGLPVDDECNAALAAIAERAGVPVIATTAAHFATPDRGHRAAALAAIRARRSLDDIAGWLAPVGSGYLRSGAE
ncbi:MAG: PHP domain-containing protein, partial [Nocardia sp.]|nr:PHP domain-containing protein [Nocardia sp.]